MRKTDRTLVRQSYRSKTLSIKIADGFAVRMLSTVRNFSKFFQKLNRDFTSEKFVTTSLKSFFISQIN